MQTHTHTPPCPSYTVHMAIHTCPVHIPHCRDLPSCCQTLQHLYNKHTVQHSPHTLLRHHTCTARDIPLGIPLIPLLTPFAPQVFLPHHEIWDGNNVIFHHPLLILPHTDLHPTQCVLGLLHSRQHQHWQCTLHNHLPTSPPCVCVSVLQATLNATPLQALFTHLQPVLL